MCWIYMWCFTLGQQEERENVFRLNQLRQVITKLKADYRYNLKVDLFYRLIESCYQHSNYKTLNVLYETMCRYDVQPDNRIKQMHFFLRREDFKAQKLSSLSKDKELPRPDPKRRQTGLAQSAIERFNQPR